MKLLLPITVLFTSLAASAAADELIVPNHAPTTAGSGGYNTLLRSMPRSYQLVVGPEELMSMPAGSTVTGITWRRPTWQLHGDWPGGGFTCSWTNYDIYLSTSLNPPGSLSTTYTDNIGPDVVQVRGGPLSMSGAFFPGGALTPQVNPFGTTLVFSTPYTYPGGDLLLTIRHDGNNCGANGSLDTVPSPFTQAIGVSSYTQPDNWYPQGLISMRLEFTPPAAVGSSYCGPASANSTGAPATIEATGSAGIAANDVTLTARDLPAGQFGYFLNSMTQGFAPGPGGSQGTLCLAGAIGRYNPSAGYPVQNSGSTGSIGIVLDLPNTPTPAGFTSINAGQTWNFQAWYRDNNPGPTSNFTDGLSVTFF